MKKVFYALVIAIVFGCIALLCNYLLIARPIKKKLQTDPRDMGIELSGHYRYYIIPSTLVLNLTDVEGSHSQLDVFRTVLQASQELKDKNFKDVIFAFKNASKFKVDGTYFKKLGETYDTENPLYTVRTFPEHVFNLDGSSAYAQLNGGVLGVLTGEMNQFKDFSEKWYGNDLNHQ
ncbi:hypothetical protein KHS38_15090 [Mucilaginibacter sp. Bleaf8]|uniref:hypothetical protein n=1 Tax=Mucilaginibacter sp. Bleaf8 TaxID=2834430 RepID=UPI001BCBB689|nr:hypothetical protein [Mucilaginibacter sp. Bleaf8]MBS7565732.1 hypothetical protein [Mucilaginibacter sp. Bleaf8]